MQNQAGDKPLSGQRILITRPAAQAHQLAQLIESAGGEAVLFPTLEIIPVRNPEAEADLNRSKHWRWVIFISANAVHYAAQLTHQNFPCCKAAELVAIGAATRKTLQQYGLTSSLMPTLSNSESLLTSNALSDIAEQQILIVKGLGGRTLLEDTLRSRGANVQTAEIYQRLQPNTNNQALLADWQLHGLSCVTITSIESLNNFLVMIGEQGRQLLLQTQLITLSERIAKAARLQGFTQVVAAQHTSDSSLLESIVELAS